jgi:hypothetical protein
MSGCSSEDTCRCTCGDWVQDEDDWMIIDEYNHAVEAGRVHCACTLCGPIACGGKCRETFNPTTAVVMYYMQRELHFPADPIDPFAVEVYCGDCEDHIKAEVNQCRIDRIKTAVKRRREQATATGNREKA